MGRGKYIILVLLVVAFLFTGCTQGEKLSDMTIVQGMAIDKVDDSTSVTLQYLNLAKSSGATDTLSDSITTTVSSKGDNISDAIFSASNSLSKAVFFGQNKVIVLGKDYASDDVSKGVDYLLRSADSRPDVYVAISDTDASAIVKNKERGARIPAQSLYDLIDKADDNGIGVAITVNDLVNFYADPTSDMFVPVLHSDRDSVSCEGIAVFRDNKYALTLDREQSLGFNFIYGRVSDGTMDVTSRQLGSIGYLVNHTSAKRRVYAEDKDLYFGCDISIDFILNDIENGTTVSIGKDEIADIERIVSKKIKKECLDSFNACVSSGCDPFAVGRYLARYDSDLYQYYSQDWHRYVSAVHPVITVRAKLSRINDNSLRG